MRIEYIHKVKFEALDSKGKSVGIPIVENPIYVYKVGDIISVYSFSDMEFDSEGYLTIPDNIRRCFVVDKVEHDLETHDKCDQTIIVHLKEIDDTKSSESDEDKIEDA
jgi:hypothetical protein